MPSYVLTNPRGESVTVTSLPEFTSWRRRNYTLATGTDAAAIAAFGGNADNPGPLETYGALGAAYASPALTLRGRTKSALPVSNMLAQAHTAGHGWAMSGVYATADVNDTTDVVLGSQSVKFTTNGAGGLPNLQKTLAAPVDLTGKYLRLWLKVDNYTNLNSVSLWIGDSALTNRFSGNLFDSSLEEAKSNLKAGEWAVIDVAANELTTVAGSPSLAAIQTFRVRIYDNGSAPVTVRFAGLAVVNAPARVTGGLISLTFDDSYASAYSIARPRMDAYGYAGTCYPIIDQLGGGNKMTLAQLKALQDVNGWDVGSHATTSAQHSLGFAGRNAADLDAELAAMVKWNTDNGFRGDTFAYPVATFDAAGELAASRHFPYTRTTNSKINEVVPPTLPHRIRAIAVGASTTLAEIQGKIDRAKAGNTWLILIYHDLVTSAPVGNASLTSLFDSTLAYIAAQAVPVRTMSQVLNPAT